MTHPRIPLTTVHEALDNAVFAAVGPGEPVAFRLDPELKRRAMQICEMSGTSLSEFLRQCVQGLVSDYQDPTRG